MIERIKGSTTATAAQVGTVCRSAVQKTLTHTHTHANTHDDLTIFGW